ncbi:Uncharacterised protein [Streptococcus dysgalactiae]|uniref:Uncharacterized protein n=1 Tax=Streptococcus dysgalactiae TaxID=1334 RepID=A0A9X9QN43_STRDY|nr:Uncharacterised protein [Streptococcus dysgalactiae]
MKGFSISPNIKISKSRDFYESLTKIMPNELALLREQVA